MSLYPPPVVIPIYSIFTGVAITLTGLRFWARTSYTKSRLGTDDWLIAVGVLIGAACYGIQLWNSLKGTGGEAVSPEDAEEKAIISKKVDFTMVLIEKPAFGAIKLSLLFFYKRIFGPWASFKRINTVFIWIVSLWTFSFIVADVTLCGVHLGDEFKLDQSDAREHCGNKGLLLLMFAITSLITDLLVLSLPFFFINRLQMPPQKKWAAGMVFLLGFISTGASLLRTIFLCIAYPLGRMSWGYKPPPDQEEPLILQVFNPTFWVMVEMGLGSWAANLPPLGPLLGAMGFKDAVGRAYKKVSYISSSWGASRSTQPTAATADPELAYPGSESSLVDRKRSPPLE